jgi:hypothetical protein
MVSCTQTESFVLGRTHWRYGAVCATADLDENGHATTSRVLGTATASRERSKGLASFATWVLA